MTIQDLEQNTASVSEDFDVDANYQDNQSLESHGDGKEAFHLSDKVKSGVTTGLLLLGGVGAGMLLMYIFDPQQGRRRRAVVRDKAISAGSKTADVLGKKSKDLRNRAQGVISEAKSMLTTGNGETTKSGNDKQKNKGKKQGQDRAENIQA